MRTIRKVLQSFCGLAVIVAFMFSSLWALTFWNRVSIYRHRDQYKPETFMVTDAVYSRGDEGGDSYWLMGTVRGREERLVPHVRGADLPRSTEDVARLYPKGTSIAVFYNPDATEMLIQNESLRVIEASPDFWEREARLRNRLAICVLVPIPVTLAIYLLVRRANRRRQTMQTDIAIKIIGMVAIIGGVIALNLSGGTQ